MKQEEILLKRNLITERIKATKSLTEKLLEGMEAELLGLQTMCKHPSASKSYGERIFINCSDCGWSDMY